MADRYVDISEVKLDAEIEHWASAISSNTIHCPHCDFAGRSLIKHLIESHSEMYHRMHGPRCGRCGSNLGAWYTGALGKHIMTSECWEDVRVLEQLRAINGE